MLDYTKAAIKKTVDDFKRLDYLRNVATQILYLAYLVYALCAGAGFVWANITLLAISATYFVFFLVVTGGSPQGAQGRKEPLKRTVSLIFTRCKQVVKLVTLVIMIYGIYAATKHLTAPAVVFAAFLIVGWLLQIVFEVVFKFFINRAQFILEGIEADYEQLTKPAKTVGNFFKKLAGKEIEPQKEKSKQRLWLEQKVAENRAEKIEKKQTEKRQKRQAKIDKKNTRFIPAPTLFENDEVFEPLAEEVFEPTPTLPQNSNSKITEKKDE